MAVGTRHACGLQADGAVKCLGDNEHGKRDAPEGEYQAVSAARLHTCGLRTDGIINCWGFLNTTIGLGEIDGPSLAIPTYSAVATGVKHSCGLRTDGTLTCWGDNEHGQADPPAGEFSAVTAGSSHSCGLRTDGTLACWGSGGDEARLADLAGGTIASVNAGRWHTCMIPPDGTVLCGETTLTVSPTRPKGSSRRLPAAGPIHAGFGPTTPSRAGAPAPTTNGDLVRSIRRRGSSGQ